MGKIVMFICKKGMDYYKNAKSIDNLTKYVMGDIKERKHLETVSIGGNGLDYTNHKKMVKQIKKVQKVFHKNTGRRMYHFVLLFDESLKEEEQAVSEIADLIVKEKFHDYQVIYGVHRDTDNIHIHFAMSSVNYNTGLKFHMDYMTYKSFKESIEDIAVRYLVENGIIGINIKEYERIK